MSDPETITSDEMRALEERVIDSGKVSGLALMERAGRVVVDAVFEHWPELSKGKQSAVVLCGPGNNGGDGFVIARLLKERGWDVSVFLFGNVNNLPADAHSNYERWLAEGAVTGFGTFDPASLETCSLVVDAVFGLGLNRPIPAEVSEVIVATAQCRRVAVDIPSYISSDNGKLMNDIPPDFANNQLTVTFHRAKIGHCRSDGALYSGALVVKDIGL